MFGSFPSPPGALPLTRLPPESHVSCPGSFDYTRVYDPHVRFHTKSGTVIKNLARIRAEWEDNGFTCHPLFPPEGDMDLSEFLQLLSTRPKKLQHFVATCAVLNGLLHDLDKLKHSEVTQQREMTYGNYELPLLEVFLRALDKDLNVGIAKKSIDKVKWDTYHHGQVEDADAAPTVSSRVKPLPDGMYMSAALGKTVEVAQLPKLLKTPSPQWYVSRKLDGVRCLVIVQIEMETNQEGKLVASKVSDIKCYSRNGKAFTSLDVLQQDVVKACQDWPELVEMLRNDPPIHRKTSSDAKAPGKGVIETKRFVLDGELCILRPSEDDSTTFVEDFKATVSKVRQKNVTLQDVRFFLLDFIPWSTFESRSGPTLFADRIAQGNKFVDRLEQLIQEQGSTLERAVTLRPTADAHFNHGRIPGASCNRPSRRLGGADLEEKHWI